jgi:PEP-CTERM motif
MQHSTFKLALLAASFAVAPPAFAAPVITAVGSSFGSTPITFTSGDSSFTFTGTGDIFAPTSVSTGGTGQFNTIFGAPTSYFVDRGTVTFGSGAQYAAFGSPTTIPFSNGNNFIGLRATRGSDVFYGFAFTTNNVLNSYGFETVAGQSITATTALPAVPEPGTWLLMLTGFGLVGAAMRRRTSSAALAA